MSATRLGILLGIAGALAILAWRVVDEYERELRELRTVRPTPGYLTHEPRRPTRPKPQIGAAPNKPESKGPPLTAIAADVLLTLLVVAAVVIVLVIAFGAVWMLPR